MTIRRAHLSSALALALPACAAASGPAFEFGPDGAPPEDARVEEPSVDAARPELPDVADAGPTSREAAPAEVGVPERREASVDAAPAPREADAPPVDAAALPPLEAGSGPVAAGPPPVEAAPPQPPIDVRCATEAGILFECQVEADGGILMRPGSNATIAAYPPVGAPVFCSSALAPIAACAAGTPCTGILTVGGAATSYPGACR